jgi:tRNA threonylcarbamoyladenosine biosynthesis protein TsaB
MLLLVTDTSGKNGFVALVRAGEGDEDKVEVIEEVPLAGGTFSAQLVPQIAGLLSKHAFAKSEIGAFIVVAGPGSFTGLRVGLAAIKALAEILHKPIVPVSLLEVIGRSSIFVAAGGVPTGGLAPFRYAAALDAGRSESFVGQYEIGLAGKTDRSFRSLSEALLDFESLAGLIESGTAQWIATPDPVIWEFLTNRLGASKRSVIFKWENRPRAAEIATAGWGRLMSGETVAPDQLEANYLRRSDAELFAKPAPHS